VIRIEEIELYNELEERRELNYKIKQKFWPLEPLSKLYNIIVNIYSSTLHVVEFLELVERVILLDNHMR